MILNSIGTVSSISEGPFKIYFATDNGIFSYDKLDDQILFENTISRLIPNKKIKILLYDKLRDYFWILSDNKLYFKSSLGIYWRESDIDLSLYGSIKLGYSDESIIVYDSFNYVFIDPYTGSTNREYNLTSDIFNSIVWSDPLYLLDDLDRYLAPDGWEIRNSALYNYDSTKNIRITSIYKDSDGNKWLGTDKSLIIKIPSFSYRMQFIWYGLSKTKNTISHFHNGNYYFCDNQFIRMGSFSKNMIGDNVCSVFSLNDKVWSYINIEFGDIGSSDVNDILVIDDKLYLSTMNGISIYNLGDNQRKFLSVNSGLKDNAVWKIETYNNIIYLATSRGINEFSFIVDEVISTGNKALEFFDGYEIYDIKINDNFMYVSCINGIYRINLINENIQKITNRALRNIDFFDNVIIGNDRDLWSIDLADFKESKITSNIQNFSIFKDHVWINKKNKAQLHIINENSENQFYIEDGFPGTRIYNIVVDLNNVVFLTNNGIGMIDWNYFND